MTKKEICNSNPTVGVYSEGLAGLEIKYIEYDIDDYVYYVALYGNSSYHKSKIYYSDRPYFKFRGRRIHFDEVLRIR